MQEQSVTQDPDPSLDDTFLKHAIFAKRQKKEAKDGK